MSREDPHFRLRLPETLRDKLRTEAARNNRSINAEIVSRLEAGFAPLPPLGSPNPFETYADTVAKALAAEAAVQAIDSVLKALNAPEGTSDAERFRMLVKGTLDKQRPEDPESAN